MTTDRSISVIKGQPLFYRLAQQFGLDLNILLASIDHNVEGRLLDTAATLSADASLADAAATVIDNQVKGAAQIEEAFEFAGQIPGIIGSVVIVGDHLGVRGQVELINP